MLEAVQEQLQPQRPPQVLGRQVPEGGAPGPSPPLYRRGEPHPQDQRLRAVEEAEPGLGQGHHREGPEEGEGEERESGGKLEEKLGGSGRDHRRQVGET